MLLLATRVWYFRTIERVLRLLRNPFPLQPRQPIRIFCVFGDVRRVVYSSELEQEHVRPLPEPLRNHLGYIFIRGSPLAAVT